MGRWASPAVLVAAVALGSTIACSRHNLVSQPPPGDGGVTLTPGLRTHLGNDWYFLAGLPVPLTEQRVGDIGMIFWFMKAW